MKRFDVKRFCWIALLLPSAALMGCAAPSPDSIVPAALDVPRARAPLPSAKLMKRRQPEGYSERVSADIENWDKQLANSPAR